MKRTGTNLGRIIQNIAPKIGAKVLIEPSWQFAGQITFKNGAKRYFDYSTIDINTMGAAKVAKDKDYANFFLEKMGYPIVPKSKTFYSDAWGKTIRAKNRDIHTAYKYALKIGLPVIVKPNSKSQGFGVAAPRNKTEFYRAMKEIFKEDRVAIVQQKLSGQDYRIVVLDGKIISAYERIALNVVGDGVSSIAHLLNRKQKKFIATSRDTGIKIADKRIVEKLKSQGFSLSSILKKDQKVFLLDNANLSTGGDSVDVTDTLHPEFKALAANITRDMGLRFCGVDLMIHGDITKAPENWWILEINSSPGLDHYAKIGKAQEKIVENLYLKALKAMEKQIESKDSYFEEAFKERSIHILFDAN